MKPFSLLLILLGSILCSAQSTFRIQGLVYDFHDKTALGNALIKVGAHTTTSDSQGKFSISNIKKGTYVLTVTHPECNPFSENITLDRDLSLSITLEHHIADIEGVTIHGSHGAKGSVIMQTLSQEDIERNSTENLGNLLSALSGVTTLKTGNNIAKPVIHGLYGSRVSILSNGVRLAEQEWGVEHSPNVDINEFDHIDVIKGASALKYGNEGVGGVVILVPPAIPKKDTIMGSIKLSGITNGRGGSISSAFLKSWENQWFVRSGGSYKKLGDLSIPHHTLQNSGAEVNSFNFAVGNHNFMRGLEFSYSGINQEFGIYRGAHLGSPEDFYNAISTGQPYFLNNFSYKIANPRQQVNHHIAKLSAYRRFADFGKMSFQYSFQYNRRKEYDIRRGGLNDLASMDLQLLTHNASLTHLLERSEWILESGLSGGLQDNFPNPDTQARRLIPDYYRYDAGVFSVFKYRLNTKLRVEAGARYDFSRYDAYKYYDESEWESNYATVFPEFLIQKNGSRVLARPILNYQNFSGNMGLEYESAKDWEARINLSVASRSPNAAELFADGLHHSAAIIEEGFLSIRKETVYHANLALTSRFDVLKGLNVEVNPYLMVSDSFINQVPTGVTSTNRGVFPVWSFQQIKARIYGIDADAELNIREQMKWSSSFSALRGEDMSHSEDLILMMPANLKNALEYRSIMLQNLYVRVEHEHVFKQNRFPLRNPTVDFIENGLVVSRELDLSSSPAAYTLFNAALGADLMKNLNFNFRINNLFNTAYREYLNRLRYFMPENGRNFIVTLNYKF